MKRMTTSGWCNDLNHGGCTAYFYGKFEHTCSCECHEKGK